ncbi:8787_t:CDS:1 [Acaulospora morrowiae]|uniref:8787_t:CDS:1 n=1 Tax=Acaulospora morrowiae TaxID=94023 RepID=A0A9N8YT16_9GLOM|nr:8787_t:CDS:1 [Acaulospora morrowiae]
MATTNSITNTASRPCVFINLGETSSNNVSPNSELPLITPPFPPTIDPRDLITLLPDGRVPARAPNAFLIYRKAFIDAVRDSGNYLPMTVVSPMASRSWEQASDVVKEEYKRLARKAFDYRNEICPKSQRRKKREKWNVVSFNQFSTPSSSSLGRHTRKSPNNKSAEVQRSTASTELPPSSTPEIPNVTSPQQTDFQVSPKTHNFAVGNTGNSHGLPIPDLSLTSSDPNSVVSSPDLNEKDKSDETDMTIFSQIAPQITFDEQQSEVWFEPKYSSIINNDVYNFHQSYYESLCYKTRNLNICNSLFYSIPSYESRTESPSSTFSFPFDSSDNVVVAFPEDLNNSDSSNITNVLNNNVNITPFCTGFLSSPSYYF